MGIPDHLICFLRNLYSGQGATVRTRYGTTDWFQIGKGVCQGHIFSLCLFNFYPEYIMQNARLNEAQAGIKIARRNINNLIYTDDTILMAESEEELKSPLMKLKEESEKVGLKLNIQKMKIMAYGLITSRQIDGETVETVKRLYCLGLQNHCRWWLQPWNKKTLAPWKRNCDQPRQHIKKQRHYFADKGPNSQSNGFSSSHVWIWELEYKAERRRSDAFELWCWKRLLRVPWTARSSNQSILREISPKYSLEGLMLKLKLQYFGHLMRSTDSLEKSPDAGQDWRQEKGLTED